MNLEKTGGLLVHFRVDNFIITACVRTTEASGPGATMYMCTVHVEIIDADEKLNGCTIVLAHKNR